MKAPIGEIFSVVGGGTPDTSRPELWDGTIPWATSADIDEHGKIAPRRGISEAGLRESAANRVPAGSVVVVTRVGLGKVGLAESDLSFSQDCQALLFPSDLLLPRFVAFQMRNAVLHFKFIGRGTTISGVTKRQLLETEFLIAPLSEQRRVVDEIEKQFTRLDAAVAALKLVQEMKLGRYRTSVLKAACGGRLVPTEAELAHAEGRSYEPAQELLSRILQERRFKWEAKQVSKIARRAPAGSRRRYLDPVPPTILPDAPPLPDGWTWASLDQLSWSSGYGTSSKCDYAWPGVPVLRIPNISRGRIDLEDLKFAGDSLELDEEFALAPDDLLVIRTNGSRDLIGRGSVVAAPFDRDHFFASYLIRFRLLPSVSRYVATIWHSPYVRNMIEGKAATSAGQYNISMRVLARLAIPLPPVNEMGRINGEADRMTSVLDEIEIALKRDIGMADRLRWAVLKQAFEGKLVPQDPSNEPASDLLDRIRTSRAAAAAVTRLRPSRKKPGVATQGVS